MQKAIYRQQYATPVYKSWWYIALYIYVEGRGERMINIGRFFKKITENANIIIILHIAEWSVNFIAHGIRIRIRITSFYIEFKTMNIS